MEVKKSLRYVKALRELCRRFGKEITDEEANILNEVIEREHQKIINYPSIVAGRRATRANKPEDYWSKNRKQQTDDTLKEVESYLKEEELSK